ncbi:uncharacterized protein IL334_001836 [Kwoniella shivajii]|uniref:ATP-dependent DNA helicase n=1 Tax=Kwoniella shivajii TaxID=564305 RepID=A0ABZ1CT07_9TREE|nr:hypothetical protein IL334_001836 [Kwoniella shivajii]
MSGFQLYTERLSIPPSNAQASSSRTTSSSRSRNITGQTMNSYMSTSNSEPIFIDDEDDDDIPIAQAVSSSKPSNGMKSERMENGGYRLGGRTEKVLPLDVEAKEALNVALAKLDREIKDVEAQLRPLQELHSSLSSERRALESQLLKASSLPKPTIVPSTKASVQSGLIDYQSSNFIFAPQVMQNLKNTFHLNHFRLCQEGVINAAVDGRDIVCVMPTGGGKSLTYQLPAVMGRGLTVVISPLLALIWDQVRGLKELGVECVMMTGATSTSEQNEIYERMRNGSSTGNKEIRLCYVTPEKVSKSKRLISTLEKLNEGGRLRRFVIDEAHCCSQLGHDFRPDYKKLSMLKTLFPRVPIQAVTATLSSKTLPDLLKILRLGPITDGRAAKSTGTVFFSAPLFRPNLHYKVLPKPSNAKSAIAAMGAWIQKNHPGQSGIIYCLSKKDTETVAEELREWSNGDIKTGIYHAGIGDYEKERIHVGWRQGKVNVICATIAFGLGIDKGDVRYMSKSLEGYYQETGRAGRDGQDSDCVLFYRGQDAARLSSLTYGDVDGSSKLQEMLRFAQDLRTCRKVAFAKYFSASAHLSASAWDAPDSLSSSSGSTSSCGICDNCLRPADSIITKDVTIETWKILKVAQAVERDGGRVTLANLADLVRGLGGGLFGVVGGGEGKKGKRKLNGEKEKVDLEEVGGKITMSKDDIEALLTHLILLGYLSDSYHATAFSVNVYIKPSDSAVRLTRLRLEDIQAGKGIQIECTFLAIEPRMAKSKKGKKSDTDEDADDDGGGDGVDKLERGKGKSVTKKAKTESKAKPKTGKAKGKKQISDESGDEGAGREWFDLDFDEKGILKQPKSKNGNMKLSRSYSKVTTAKRRGKLTTNSVAKDLEEKEDDVDIQDMMDNEHIHDVEEEEEDEWDDDGWEGIMDTSGPDGFSVIRSGPTNKHGKRIVSVSDSD